MQREIKFRAWDGLAGERKMWHFDLTENVLNVSFLAKNLPIMQYTGLKDSKGAEIYEGDILRRWRGEPLNLWESQVYIVDVYECAGHWARTRNIDETGKNPPHYYKVSGSVLSQGDYEVIGNIYEHPHLLEDYNNPVSEAAPSPNIN